MKKLLTILFLFCFFLGNAQYRNVDWKTNVLNVITLGTDTFQFDAVPIDYTDPGSSTREIGNYFVDFIGQRYKVIDSDATTITIVDEIDNGFAPTAWQIGRVYQSVGNGDAHYIGGVDITVLDDLSKWKIVAADNELFWTQLGQPFDTVSYNTSYVVTENENTGTTYWDVDNSTYSDVLENGVIGQRYQEMFIPIKNETGSTVTDGTPIMWAGSVGASGRLKGTLAIADGSIRASFIIGIATEEIVNNDFGLITTQGAVRGINTTGSQYGESWDVGDTIYVSAVTAGYLTNTAPNAPNFQIEIGIVTVLNSNIGTLTVRPTWADKLIDSPDVDGTPLITNGQMMVWSNDSSYFNFDYNINDYVTESDVSVFATTLEAITGLTDTTTISPLTNADVDELRNVPYYGARENIYTDYNITGDTITADTFIGGFDKTTSLPDDSVFIHSLNVTPSKSVSDYLNTVQASGYYVGGEFADNLDGTIDVAAGFGAIRATNVLGAQIMAFMWAESLSLVLTDNSTNYIYADYNSGTPIIAASTTRPTDARTKVLLGKVYREGSDAHLFKAGMYIPELAKNVLMRFVQQFGEITRVSGGVISETGTLNIASTDAGVWGGLTYSTTTGYDTNVSGTFEYYYYDGAVWVESDETQINNTQYNDITTGLESLPPQTPYGIHWVYIDPDGHMMVMYGQDSYTLSDAEKEQPPALRPDHIIQFAWLAAKIIIERNDATFTEIISAYDISFTGQTAGNHNELGGLDGGEVGFYGHTTADEYLKLQDSVLIWNDTILYIATKTDIDIVNDSLVVHRTELNNLSDSLVVHRTDINQNTDSLIVHRTDINTNTSDIVILNDSIDQHRIEINANLDSINVFRPLIDANTGKDTTGIYHSNRTDLDLVSGTNTGDQDLSGIRDTLVFHSDSLLIAFDSITELRTDINQNATDIAAIPTTEAQTATLLETQTGIIDTVFTPPLTVANTIELNSIQPYGETEDLYMPDRNITADTFIGYFAETDPNFLADVGDSIIANEGNITITESQISDLATFTYNEVPTGLINGSNTTFTTASTFVTNSTQAYLNGIRQRLSVHYIESGSTIVFQSGYIPETGDILFLDYEH